MIFRNLIFEAEVIKQRFRAGLVSHHEQQTSQRSREKQHLETLPAYNVNLADATSIKRGTFSTDTGVLASLRHLFARKRFLSDIRILRHLTFPLIGQPVNSH